MSMNTILDISNLGAADGLNAAALNEGLLDTIRGMEHSILSVGLALVKIKTEKLYRDLGFRNISAYVLFLAKQSQKDRSSIYKWLQIGEIYLKYSLDLEAIGFSGSDSPTKLPYLERALAGNPKDEVYSRLKTMTQREFASYAKHGSNALHSHFAKGAGENPAEAAANAQDKVNESSFGGEAEAKGEAATPWGHSFFYKGIEAARVSKNLPRRIYRMLIPAIRLSFNALDKRSYVVAVHLDNYREYIRFLEVAVDARTQMRAQMRETMDQDLSRSSQRTRR